ncbi:MAG: hypothetical protein WBL93_11980 [Lutisporaceae bacterium]
MSLIYTKWNLHRLIAPGSTAKIPIPCPWENWGDTDGGGPGGKPPSGLVNGPPGPKGGVKSGN